MFMEIAEMMTLSSLKSQIQTTLRNFLVKSQLCSSIFKKPEKRNLNK
jgi:hypothetical protein